VALLEGGGKLPGKTVYAGRRRPMTRRSGFKTHEDATGGEFERVRIDTYEVKHRQTLTVLFKLPANGADEFLAFGGWFHASRPVTVGIHGGPPKLTLTMFSPPDWNKFGSIWQGNGTTSRVIRISFAASSAFRIALHGLICGIVEHKHLQGARAELLSNMFEFAPEAIFVKTAGIFRITYDDHSVAKPSTTTEIVLKSCNRCGRYLPINTVNERNHLSFSNHCVAANRCPCSHATFSKLRNRNDASDRIALKHGYQLECRYCKKFEVNAAHNPQRTTAQMKEDAARRRAFELLITELEGGSSQLKYRHETGRELAEDVYRKFGGKCFNCLQPLSERGWDLDHTRPLALLWPLDGTATALCGVCNSDKRDRPPAEFYNTEKLAKLAKVTGIPLAELTDPTPNIALIKKLATRLDWFFGSFLCSEDMRREHDGKVPRELLLKALYKALSHSSKKIAIELIQTIKRMEKDFS